MVSRKRRVVFSIILISVIFCLAAAWFVKQANADTIDSIEIFCPSAYLPIGVDVGETYQIDDPNLVQAILSFFDEIHYSVPASYEEIKYAKEEADWYYVFFYHGSELVQTYRFTVYQNPDCIQFRVTDNWYDWYIMEYHADTLWQNFMAVLRSSDETDEWKAEFLRSLIVKRLDPY